MKKLSILLVTMITFSVLLTGCSKRYSTVTEYAKAMDETKKNIYSYLFEGELMSNKDAVEQPPKKFKYYYVNGKSKLEFYRDNGQLLQTIYFDGREIFTHAPGQDFLLIIFTEKMLNSIPDNERTMTFNIMTGRSLYNWESPTGTNLENNFCPLSKAKFKKRTKMNGHQCRLITFGQKENDYYSETCVNDKLGVAVYNKLKATSQGKSTQIIMNVNSITTNSLNEYDIEPASYLNKYTMSELFTKVGTLLSRMN